MNKKHKNTMKIIDNQLISSVEEEAKHQARIIRNAASYLTREAQEGIAAGST